MSHSSRRVDTNPLDKVVWNALTGKQNRFSIGDERVRRYLPEIAPFAAMVDTGPASFEALRKLIWAHGAVAFNTIDALPVQPGLSVVRHAALVQMTWQGELGPARA